MRIWAYAYPNTPRYRLVVSMPILCPMEDEPSGLVLAGNPSVPEFYIIGQQGVVLPVLQEGSLNSHPFSIYNR